MPIVDFNTAEPWDSFRIWRYNISERARARIATSGLRGTELQTALDPWKGLKVRMGFCRYGVMRDNIVRAERLATALHISPGDRILLHGDVYGWTAEAMEDILPGANWVACDDNPLTQTRKTLSETSVLTQSLIDQGLDSSQRATVLAEIDDGVVRGRRIVIDEDASNRGSRKRINDALGGTPTHVITVGMLNFLDDVECADLSNRMRSLGGRVCHIVTPFSKPSHGKPEPFPPLNWKHISENRVRDTQVDRGGGDIRDLDSETNISSRNWISTNGLVNGDTIIHSGSFGVHV